MNRKNIGANTNTLQICFDIITLALAYICACVFFGVALDDKIAAYSLSIGKYNGVGCSKC